MRQNIQMMISEEEIRQRVKELGRLIEADYSGKDLVVIGLLKGVFPFFADLVRAIDLDFHVTFMRISSYGFDLESSGKVKILQDIDTQISGKNVLIVEDIIDTGQTLAMTLEHLKTQSPASIRICVLLDKPSRRIVDVPVDYVGFSIKDVFVVGYGLDAREMYRNLPYIGIFHTESNLVT
ncbi:MAG: hypoxanthine phosphoribosyltransferase [Holophagales bacterium]|nr:hypoxanthine phosphoribosyltransferase [Holophagales bacterium]